MAAGRAVIASDLPGNAEVVQDGESALLVPAGDAGALGAAIRRLRDDPLLRERLAERARRLAFEQYTWDARARGIMQGLGVGD
ncbi:MAG: glycosyltransferase, partial [Anaerolineae bacterium]|nr:glycosyltransferase [Anaerolineae bacterium]